MCRGGVEIWSGAKDFREEEETEIGKKKRCEVVERRSCDASWTMQTN